MGATSELQVPLQAERVARRENGHAVVAEGAGHDDAVARDAARNRARRGSVIATPVVLRTIPSISPRPITFVSPVTIGR